MNKWLKTEIQVVFVKICGDVSAAAYFLREDLALFYPAIIKQHALHVLLCTEIPKEEKTTTQASKQNALFFFFFFFC